MLVQASVNTLVGFIRVGCANTAATTATAILNDAAVGDLRVSAHARRVVVVIVVWIDAKVKVGVGIPATGARVAFVTAAGDSVLVCVRWGRGEGG